MKDSNSESSRVPARQSPDAQPTPINSESYARAGVVLGSIGDHWTQRQKHKLLLVEVKIFGRKVVALVDSGATHNFLGADLCRKHGLRFTTRSNMVTLANGTITEATGELRSARVSIGQHAEREDFIVMDMKDEEFDCILGKP